MATFVLLLGLILIYLAVTGRLTRVVRIIVSGE